MKLDTTLSSLIDEVLDETNDETPSTLWKSTHGFVKLADLADEHYANILTVRPRHRTYLHQSDAGYDWAVGKEFVITTRSSPYYNQVVAVDETRHLKRYGYTAVHIHYNNNSAPLEVTL
ncbi:MAG TPA: hypothetical protein VKP88_06415, partial [Candidatus Paceibacterota bacterium]|nr:hypothetical protein [Candidatus Paceibacterota bacterium]